MNSMSFDRAVGMQALQLKGRVVRRSLMGDPLREYFVYVPESRQANRIVVLMHGISENACEQILRFAPEGERRGVVLVAPLFRRSVYGQYQQLADRRSGVRADHALIDIIDAVSAEHALPAQPVDLFGFSGGGQFAHRFAFAHSQSVRSCVLVAPGWFTFPDSARSFPQGLKNLPQGRQAFDERAVRAIPFHVVVGDRDVVRDGTLRRTPGLDRRQGRTRLERAARWHKAMEDWGGDPRSSLTILQGLGHSFSQAAEEHDLPKLTFELLDLL